MNKTEAEYFLQQAKQAASDLRQALYMLHEHQGYKLLGYDTWSAFVAAELGQSARTIRGYLQQADAEQRLQQAGWQHVAASGRALVALQRLVVENENGDEDDSHMQTVYRIASDNGTVKVTTDRIKTALQQIDQTITTSAVELPDGEQIPVIQALAERVNAEVHEVTNRDNCRWIVSRLPATIENIGEFSLHLWMDRRLPRTPIPGLLKQRVVISIGIEDEVNA